MAPKNSMNLQINFKKEAKSLKFDLAEGLMSARSKNCKKKRSEEKTKN